MKPSTVSEETRSLLKLSVIFLIWKSLLFFLAITSPGRGYDTSTSLLLDGTTADASFNQKLIRQLTRWDSIYFVSIAQRGYLFEQEWAFGWGFSQLVSFVTRQLSKLCDNRVLETEYSQAGVAIIIANISHLLSVLVLYKLTRKIWPESQGKNQAFISASLHILSPAGLFLSAPYAESSFSLLSFLGYLSYAKGLQNTESILGDLQVVVAGAVFGIATTFRSNGLLNGTVFLLDFLIIIRASLQTGLELARARRALALAIGGCLIGIGFIIPQGIAWHEYCSSDSGRLGGTRPWCLKMIPSIYTWVQSYYWNVGFLKYWTVSNIPLFLSATPALMIMTTSAIDALRQAPSQNTARIQASSGVDSQKGRQPSVLSTQIPWRFALPQLILASLATTNYHVQIITRISSGYIVWYWWIASLLTTAEPRTVLGMKWNASKWVVRWMVIYSLVQAGLFASFLPPA